VLGIDAYTSLYGIIGRPVRHSLSPAMHNAAFEHEGINAVYLAFETDSPRRAMDAVRTLNIKGLSVTVPHKETVMEFLDETDDTAKRIGAVNTIKNLEGHLKGINTDWIGALKALRAVTAIKDRLVVVLGAGGSARAVVYGLVKEGAKVHIANRTEEKARSLAEEFSCAFSGLDNVSEIEGEILINTTSVGMGPLAGICPVPASMLGKFSVVMDIVYGKGGTRLLQEARSKGCTTIPGIEMLLYQAAAQFEFWTGHTAPLDVMRQALSSPQADRKQRA